MREKIKGKSLAQASPVFLKGTVSQASPVFLEGTVSRGFSWFNYATLVWSLHSHKKRIVQTFADRDIKNFYDTDLSGFFSIKTIDISSLHRSSKHNSAINLFLLICYYCSPQVNIFLEVHFIAMNLMLHKWRIVANWRHMELHVEQSEERYGRSCLIVNTLRIRKTIRLFSLLQADWRRKV